MPSAAIYLRGFDAQGQRLLNVDNYPLSVIDYYEMFNVQNLFFENGIQI